MKKTFLLVGFLPLVALAQTPAPQIVPGIESILDTGEALAATSPDVIGDPVDFGQMARYKLQVLSLGGQSWTSTRFDVEGIDGSDPYQPGRPLIFPGPVGVAELKLTQDGVRGPVASFRFAKPGRSWHLTSSGLLTGSSLFADNLPAVNMRGTLQRSEQFGHFYQPSVQTGGRVTKKIDFMFSGSGRWATETVPEAPTSAPIRVYHLFGTVRATLRPTAKDTLDVLLIGTRLNSSGWADAFAPEALAGQRGAPPILPNQNVREEDHPDFVQVGWSRGLAGGQFQMRYGYATAHLDSIATNLPTDYQTLVTQNLVTTYLDLTNGVTSGAPLLQTLEVRPRHNIVGEWTSRDISHGSVTQAFVLTGNFQRAKSENRELWPPFLIATSVNGIPDSVTYLSTPNDGVSVIYSTEIGAEDRIKFGAKFSVDAGVLFSRWNGTIPAQSSPIEWQGFLPAQAGGLQSGGSVRSFPAQPGVPWTNAAPHVGLAWQPGVKSLALRAGFGRVYEPLSGRALDYGSPDTMSGLVYQWNDPYRDGVFQLNETGALLRRFGGLFSSIDKNVRQPYTDRVTASGEISPVTGLSVAARGFWAEDRDRLAAINTGVPFSAYQPVQIPNPIGGSLTVYRQNAATLGQDQFLLTNPAGLKMTHRGITGEIVYRYGVTAVRAAVFAGKSWGLTNPGNQAWQNDPGAIGALYADPNTLVFAAGQPAMDRGNGARINMTTRIGGVDILFAESVLGGYPFSPETIVTGLPQGAFEVAVGAHGLCLTPEVWEQNFRISRGFQLPRGRVRLSADIYNIGNFNRALTMRDIADAALGQPTSIQPPRSLRIGIEYAF